MKKKPMTVSEMIEALSKQPGSAPIAWVDADGYVGYFYADEQQMEVDDGHVHVDLGGCYD